MLSGSNFITYSRQIALWGEQSQQDLMQKKICILGIGGIGTNCAQYLAYSGINHMILADDDIITQENLNRQVLYTSSDINKKKTAVATEKLKIINPNIEIDTFGKISSTNLKRYIENTDILIDCTDNLKTRLVINALAHQYKKPHIVSAAIGYEMQLLCFNHLTNPCYQCITGTETIGRIDNCSNVGVNAATVGMAGSYAALFALYILLDQHKDIYHNWHIFNGLGWNKISINQDVNCPICLA